MSSPATNNSNQLDLALPGTIIIDDDGVCIEVVEFNPESCAQLDQPDDPEVEFLEYVIKHPKPINANNTAKSKSLSPKVSPSRPSKEIFTPASNQTPKSHHSRPSLTNGFEKNFFARSAGKVGGHPQPFTCKWPACRYFAKQAINVISHIRKVHFKVPGTLKEQKKTGIYDPEEVLKYVGND